MVWGRTWVSHGRMDRIAPATSFSKQDWVLNTGLLMRQQSRGSAGKSHFLGIVIILGSAVIFRKFPVSWGSGGCLRGGEGSVPRPASSQSPGSKQRTVLRLHVQSLQLHYWITLTGRPLVSYFITWVKKKMGRSGKNVYFVSANTSKRGSHRSSQEVFLWSTLESSQSG